MKRLVRQLPLATVLLVLALVASGVATRTTWAQAPGAARARSAVTSPEKFFGFPYR